MVNAELGITAHSAPTTPIRGRPPEVGQRLRGLSHLAQSTDRFRSVDCRISDSRLSLSPCAERSAGHRQGGVTRPRTG